MLVHYWVAEKGIFIIDGMPLYIEVEVIYFITRLSRRRGEFDMKGRAHGGLNNEDHISVYCVENIGKVGSLVPTKEITNSSINIILFTISVLEGLTSLHQASQTTMFVALEFLRLIVYDWSKTLLINMKK